MAKKGASHKQAQLMLQLYDLRRETRMRAAREWFFSNYHPETLEQANQMTPVDSDESAYARMVTTYWDQACALLNHGLLHEELFFETNGEFYAVYYQLRPILAELRKQYGNPYFYEHLEKTGRRYEQWVRQRAPKWLEAGKKYTQQLREKARAAAAAKASLEQI